MPLACLSRIRFHLCSCAVVAAFALLGARLYTLQVVQADDIRQRETPLRERQMILAAKRGEIMDRHGNLLAGTRSRIQVGLDPWSVKADERQLARLAGVLDIDFEVVQEAANRRERKGSNGKAHRVRWVPLCEIGEDLYPAVLQLGIAGVYGNRHYERAYPGGELAAHTIGYVNREGTAVMGVEQALDFYLRGQSGWTEVAVDGQRRELAGHRGREVAPRDGQSVRLTLDLVVQSIVEQAMQELVAEADPKAAVIIVSDPRSGEILALANHPNFDPNNFWDFPLEAQRNRAVSDQYEPGSTFKIIPIAAALDEGILHRDSLFDCSITHMEYAGVNVPLPSDHRDLGTVPLHVALQKSSNRAAAQVGMLLGKEKLYDWASKMGIGQSYDWPLAGAARGSLAKPADWDGYAISRVPTGYAVAATPMQMHLAMAAIANEGVWIAPKLVLGVEDSVSGQILPWQRDERRTVVSANTSREMRAMLRSVVSREGTAARAAIEGYQVAGKTGTARKIHDGRYSFKHHLASFSGFFPASAPEVVITVMVDEPKTTQPGYGGAIAAPVFHRISERLIPQLAIRKPAEWETFFVSRE